MVVNGGLVKEVIPFPHRKGWIAVKGIWSGGKWTPKTQIWVYQQRRETLLGVWRMVGVDRIAGCAEPILILSPQREHITLIREDVLLFGEGRVTSFEIDKTTLPIKRDCSIEIGSSHYRGIVTFNPFSFKLFMFHEESIPFLSRRKWQLVWWQEREYFIRMVLPLRKPFLEIATLERQAKAYRKEGDQAKAVTLFEQLLEAQQQVRGNEHESLVRTLYHLGTLHLEQGYYAQAKTRLEQAVTMAKQVHGDEHPEVARCLNNLAWSYYKQGDRYRATSLLERALEIARKFFGEMHPELSRISNNYAIVLGMERLDDKTLH